jgi:site-specific DNA recombinase
MNGVIYARYSSDNQREESIEGQLRECQEYADRQGITVFGTYIDRALSAKTDNRPEFQRMIRDSAKHLFDVVIVWKLDRFARNRYDSAYYKMMLKKNGVKVLSAKENISDRPEGILLESMLEGYAKFYSAELSEKILRGMQENALKCKYNGGALPLGYTTDREQRYLIDAVTAPVVQEIFTSYAGGATVKEICDTLNERGIKTQYGNAFNKNSLHRMLNNRRYIGEYIYRDTVIPGGIPAIIPAALFDRVQQRMEKNVKAPAREKADVKYLLTTKLFCGKCGAFMVGESGTSKTGKTHYYYKCANVKRFKTCQKRSVQKDWIENFVVDYTMKYVLVDGAIEHIADDIMDLQQSENVILPSLHRQLKDTQKGIDNMLDAIQQGIITPSTKQRLDELEAAKEKLEISILQEEMQKPLLTREQVVFWISRFKKGNAKDQAFRSKLIDASVNSVYLYDDKMVLTYNYKDGAKTVSLSQVEAALGERDWSSDFGAVAPPAAPLSRSRNYIRLRRVILPAGSKEGEYNITPAKPEYHLRPKPQISLPP